MQTNYATKLLQLKDANFLCFDKTTKIPFVLDEFIFVETLSRALNSVVKRYHHHSIKKAVVIKQILIPHVRLDENQEQKFDNLKKEIEFLQLLSGSKNVVDFYGFYIDQDYVYICLESMDISLKELYLLVHRLYGNFPEELMVKIIIKIVDALCECHENSITHRDVKPHNILVNWGGDIKLCDFGVSRIIYETSTYTTIVGTYPYMPPEYFKNGQKYGQRVDVWSLGITLIEILHGKNIISGECRIPEIENVIKNFNYIVENLPKIYSDELKEFIMQCLTIKYENRPTLEGLKNLSLYKNENEDGSNSFKSVIITTILHNSRLLFDKQHIDNSCFIVQEAEQIRNMKIIDDIRKAFQNLNIEISPMNTRNVVFPMITKDVVFPMITKDVVFQTIDRRSLGNIFRLGDLYDCYRDQISDGNIFRNNLDKITTDVIKVSSIGDLRASIIKGNRFKDRIRFMFVEPELAISTIAGLNKTIGHGQFITDEPTTDREVATSFIYILTTEKHQIDLSKVYQLVDTQIIFNTANITHFVSAIDFGFILAVTTKATITPGSNAEIITDQMEGFFYIVKLILNGDAVPENKYKFDFQIYFDKEYQVNISKGPKTPSELATIIQDMLLKHVPRENRASDVTKNF